MTKKGIMTQSLKRESSNYKQLWIPDQVGNDKTAKTPTFCESINIDALVKSRNIHNFVIPVKTGIQSFQVVSRLWIPAYAGMTDFLRLYQY